jgi:nucleoside-diphosphate-sugar epimerase
MKRILVTGGAGYIGSVLTRKLLNAGYEVVIFDTFFYTDIGIRELGHHPALSIFASDIRDIGSLRESLANTGCVIHLAALANDPSAAIDPELTRQINLESYPTLLREAAKAGVQRFINMSSIAVYGINLADAVTEEAPLNPLTEYSICKAKGEEIVKQFNTDSLTTVTLRSGTVCGWSPRMRFDLCANTLTALAVVDKRLTVWGGGQRRPQIHLDDLTDVIVGLVGVPAKKIGGRVFNLAGHNTTVMQVAETIREVLDRDLELTSAPPRSDERTYHVSSERIARELGFVMKKTIRDAVTEIVNAYRAGLWQNPCDPLYHNVERMKSMEHSSL